MKIQLLPLLFTFSFAAAQVKTDVAEEYTWNTTNSVWDTTGIMYTHFNSSNWVDSLVSADWNAVSKQFDQYTSRTTFTHNSNGDYLTQNYYQWNGTSWDNDGKNVNTYSVTNKITSATYSLWRTWLSAFRNYSYSTYTYDGNDYLTQVLVQTWDTVNNVWVNSSKTSYTNNSNGTAASSTSQTWDKTNNVWKNGSKATYTYTTSKKVSTQTFQYWSGSAYVNSGKATLTYDGNDNLTQLVNQSWSSGTSTWVNQSRSTTTYDGNNLPSERVFESYVSGNWVKNSKTVYKRDITATISTVNASTNNIQLIPIAQGMYQVNNSAQSSLNCIVFDMSGRIILSQQLSTGTIIDLSNFSSGVYILSFSSKSIHQKFVITK